MSILDNNISKIRKYNPKLADKINLHEFAPDVKFELVNAASNDVNLIYNGITIYNTVNPQFEAAEVLKMQAITSENTIILLFGLGLGYLFKRAYLDKNNKIIIFEPNLDILRFTLEVVDFSAELADERVFIANTRTELVNFLEEIYSYKAAINYYCLPSGNKLYGQEPEKLKNELPEIIAHLESNYTCLFERSYSWAKEGIINLPDLVNSYNIDSLKDKFKSKPAVIVSSGPSLDKNIEFLKKYRDKVVLFCVSNAFKTLIKHGIKPDFINFVDTHDNSNLIKDMDLSDTYQIVQTFTNSKVLKLNAMKKFIFYCNNDIISRWLSKTAGFSVQNYENKGTVSYSALYSAYKLGCNPIILVGQDLAYVNGECYSSSSAFGRAYKCILDEKTGKYKLAIEDTQSFTDYCDPVHKVLSEIELEKLSQIIADFPIIMIKGQNGNMIPTSPNYADFIRFFEEFAYNNYDATLKLINCSTGGAQIDGFKNMTLTEILENLPSLDISVQDTVERSLSGYVDPLKSNQDEIRKNLISLIQDIEKYTFMAKDAANISGLLIKELQRSRKNLNFIRNSVNGLINYYYKIKENLFDRHIILLNCVFKELIELNPLLENDDCVADLEGLNKIAQLSKNLYEAFLTNVIELKSLAKDSCSQLENQELNTRV